MEILDAAKLLLELREQYGNESFLHESQKERLECAWKDLKEAVEAAENRKKQAWKDLNEAVALKVVIPPKNPNPTFGYSGRYGVCDLWKDENFMDKVKEKALEFNAYGKIEDMSKEQPHHMYKIPMIKAFRELTGAGLKDAVYAIDMWFMSKNTAR